MKEINTQTRRNINERARIEQNEFYGKHISAICDDGFPQGYFSNERLDINRDYRGWNIFYKQSMTPITESGSSFAVRKIRVQSNRVLMGPAKWFDTYDTIGTSLIGDMKKLGLQDGNGFTQETADSLLHSIQKAYVEQLALKDGVNIIGKWDSKSEVERYKYFTLARFTKPYLMTGAWFQPISLQKNKFPTGFLIKKLFEKEKKRMINYKG